MKNILCDINYLESIELIKVNLLYIFVIKVLCLLLGFIIVWLGFKLILLGAKGEFKFSTDSKGIKARLESSSPGLLFVLLGVLLMCYALFVKKELENTYQTNESRKAKKIETPNLNPVDEHN